MRQPTLIVPQKDERGDDVRTLHYEAYAVKLSMALNVLKCSSEFADEKVLSWLDKILRKSGIVTEAQRGSFLQELRDSRTVKLLTLLCDWTKEKDLGINLLTGNVRALANIQTKIATLGFGVAGGEGIARSLLCKFLKALFDYDAFRQGACLDVGDIDGSMLRWCSQTSNAWNGARLVQLHWRMIRYCPYCNADTIFAFMVKGRGRKFPYASALDHYLPRSLYPYFGLSLYNLVPSCTRCNSYLKHDDETTFENSPHPYEEDIYSQFRFRMKIGKRIEDILSYYPGKNDVKVDFDKVHYNTIKARRFFGESLAIEDVYRALFLPEASILLKKLKFLTPSYRDVLVKRMSHLGGDPLEISLGMSMDPRRIPQFRLAKLAIDLKRQFCPAS